MDAEFERMMREHPERVGIVRSVKGDVLQVQIWDVPRIREVEGVGMLSKAAIEVRVIVLGIVRQLVDNEDAVQVSAEESPGLVMLSIQVAPPDVGKIVGKQGRTARSLRTILAGMGRRDGFRYEVDIVHSWEGQGGI